MMMTMIMELAMFSPTLQVQAGILYTQILKPISRLSIFGQDVIRRSLHQAAFRIDGLLFLSHASNWVLKLVPHPS